MKACDIESDNACYLKFAGSERDPGLRGRKYDDEPLRLWPRSVALFHSKINRAGLFQCWPWTGGRTPRGYGQFNCGRDAYGKQDTRYAHRIAFELATGIDPVGMVVMHACDNPPCCNPTHLSLGTTADNVRDAADKGRYRVPRPNAQVLTTEQVHLVHTSAEKGVELARRFGVSPTSISLIRRGLRRTA